MSDFGIPPEKSFSVSALTGTLEEGDRIDLRLKLEDGSHIQISLTTPAIQGMVQDLAALLARRTAAARRLKLHFLLVASSARLRASFSQTPSMAATRRRKRSNSSRSAMP